MENMETQRDSNDASENCTEDIKSEPIEEYETPEQNSDIILEDVKIEVEEHPVESKLGEYVPVFVPCTRQNLPKINMFSIVEYFVQNDSYKHVDYKKLKTDIDINAEDTIGFVQLHTMEDTMTLQGTVAFDRDTAHVCLIKYHSSTQTIEYTNCECQQPACQHILAFLMWLHRRSEEQLDNDMSFCLEPLVQQTRILRAKDIYHNSDTDSCLSEDLDVPEHAEDIQQDIVQEFFRTCKELKTYNSPLFRHLCGNEALELSVHRMYAEWRNQAPAAGARARADSFLQYCLDNMDERDTVLAGLATSQDYSIRQELQYGRIDGRHLSHVISMEFEQPSDDHELVHTILNPDMHVDDEFLEEMKEKLEEQLEIQVNKCGIILCKDYPIFCALPYGFTDTHIVDIAYIKQGEQIFDYMESNALKSYIQIRLQLYMLLANKEKSYFFIGFEEENPTRKDFVHEYRFDRNYCNILVRKGIKFWKDKVFKRISEGCE